MYLSASSRMMTFVRTTSMPRSFDAFISSTASRNESPSVCLARQSTLVVYRENGMPSNYRTDERTLPQPGGPEMMMLGRLPCRAKCASRVTASSLPTMSSSFVGRYFSSHGVCLVTAAFGVVSASLDCTGGSFSLVVEELISTISTSSDMIRFCRY